MKNQHVQFVWLHIQNAPRFYCCCAGRLIYGLIDILPVTRQGTCTMLLTEHMLTLDVVQLLESRHCQSVTNELIRGLHHL